MEVLVAVAVAGVAVAALGLLLGRRLRRARSPIAVSPEGYQEALVVIEGRYRPDTLRVLEGVPVRIRFHRKENNPCSERVIFSQIGVDRHLPPFQETTVDFVPRAAGTFLFTCRWGMYRGKLVVMPRRAATGKGARRHSGLQRGQTTWSRKRTSRS